MLIEEIKTRNHTGISHLSNDSIKKIMLSYSQSSEKGKKLVGSYSYDLLAERENARNLQYVPFH